MTRLIDADALNKKLCETTIFIKGGETFQRMINDAPTIEPDGDTISRSKAVKDVSEWATDILHPDRLVKEDAIYILESLPSAETPTVSEKHQLSEEIPTNTPTNTSTDLISRQDALAEFRDGRDVYDIMESIEELPSAQPTGDLVSRQAVLSLFSNSFYSGLAEQIKSLPSAPDSRQRGEWVRLEREENIHDLHGVPTWGVNYMCDKCGFITTAIQDHFAQYRWCPSCGARMHKGGEEE